MKVFGQCFLWLGTRGLKLSDSSIQAGQEMNRAKLFKASLA